MKKEAPYVVGNGINTLTDLINENKNSKYRTHNIDNNLLLEQNVDLQTVIPDNKKIILSKVKNLHNGGHMYNIPLNTIHPDNLHMFKRVNKILKKNITGIDYISDNISIPYYQQGAIIEVNSAPGMQHANTFSNEKKMRYLDKFVDKIFN